LREISDRESLQTKSSVPQASLTQPPFESTKVFLKTKTIGAPKHLKNGFRLEGARTPRNAWWSIYAVCLLALLCMAFLLDEQASRIVTLRANSVWHSLAGYASKAGEGWVIAVAGAIVSLLLLCIGRLKASSSVLLVALTGLLTGAAATVVRSLVGRTRPDSNEVQGFYGVWHNDHWILGRAEFGSFPSGHVATVIGLAVATWLVDRRLGIVAALYALLVTWSRVALGRHHFSDTVAAAILGVYVAPKILRAARYWANRARLNKLTESSV
jgi:membrane-associated phospholipid phosphatase